MIAFKPRTFAPPPEPETGRPASTGEEWLGKNRSSKSRLWERLNPQRRKQIRMVAEALALQQTHSRVPEPLRSQLSAIMDDLDRVIRRLGVFLAEVARRTPPRD